MRSPPNNIKNEIGPSEHFDDDLGQTGYVTTSVVVLQKYANLPMMYCRAFFCWNVVRENSIVCYDNSMLLSYIL